MAENYSLTPSELQVAALVGVERHIEALKQRRPDRHGARTDDGWTLHIEGAAGEMAASKALGTYWGATVNTYKDGGDIGSCIQVRTRSRHDYELIVRADDKSEDYFILVTGQAPHYRVHGYMRGVEAKDRKWLRTHGGREAAHFVPQAALNPLSKLRGLLTAFPL